MKEYRGTLKCIQFKDKESFDKIYKILGAKPGDEDRYKTACKNGIYINHANRIFLGEYLCEFGKNTFIKLTPEFMDNFKKG